MKRVGRLIAEEIRAAVPATIFFLLLFHMIALTKAVTLGDYSFAALRATVATLGAILVAKAILVVEALPVARLFFSRSLWVHALWKTLLFSVVVVVFRFLEEFIFLVRKHGEFAAAAMQLFREIVWPQFAVFQLWLFCGLFVYCIGLELVRMIGADRLKAMLFSPIRHSGQ